MDNGFGVNPWHEFYPTEAAAVRAALSMLSHRTARVLLQRGAEWFVVGAPALVGPPDATEYAHVRRQPRRLS